MESQLVTCIYNGLNGGKLCGRLNRDRPYNFSLGAIAKTGAKIACYTSPAEMAGLQSYFAENVPAGDIDFKPSDLHSLYFHEGVNQLRNENSAVYRDTPDWRDRCVEIMWGKFIFMRDEINSSPELEHIYWIDAGISHPGIIHSRFNPHYEHNIDFVRDLDKSTYPDTFKNELIFNPEFMGKLIRYTGDDHILNITSNNPQHPRLPTTSPVPFKGSVIGGIFGGRTELVLDYCNRVITMFEYYLSTGMLCREEQIMTEILARGEVPIKTFEFNSWYHPDWGNRYNKNQTSFCDFFDEISKP
jgi:hypothetical protein